MDLLFTCLSFLPFLCLLETLLWACLKKDASASWFTACAIGASIWSLFIVIATNILSFFNYIGRTPVLAVWIAYFLAVSVAVLRCRKTEIPALHFRRGLIPIYAILGLTLIGSLAYAPAYHDSLAYHLTRIMHWLQNGTIAPYFTSIDRQIGMAPFNSMVMLQSMAIGGNDYLVNLPQWLSFAGCIAGVMHLATQLGATGKARLFSGFFFATLPIAIMQSGNSESSLIATYWLCVFISVFLGWWERPDWSSSLIIGASLGLAILSKGIAYPVALPFVACIAWKCLRRFRKLFLYGCAAAILIIAVNVPHYYRNYEATSSVVLSAERNIILKPSPALTGVNAVFNFFLQEPWFMNFLPKKTWSNLALAVGVDDHDPAFFPWEGIETARTNLVPSDNDGQSPVHALLILIFFPWLLIKRIPGTGFYFTLTCVTFLVYFTIITWQPWGARLHLPFFLLASPLIGMAVARMSWKKIRAGILAALGTASFMPLFFCLEHPLGPASWLRHYRDGITHFLTSSRDEQMFNLWCHYMRYPYMKAADFLARQKPESIGVDLSDDGIEYPLWVLLRERTEKMPRIVHTVPPFPADGPDYIFSQPHSSAKPIHEPVIYRKEGTKYRQVYPAVPSTPGE